MNEYFLTKTHHAFNSTPMPSIPIDILRLILDHVNKPDLLNICLLNKICCSCSQDVLYHDIKIDELRKGIQVCQTLAQSTHLARRVRSFDILRSGQFFYGPEASRSFQNMIFLRNLRMYYFTDDFSFLSGCTFKLVSFSCDYFHFEPLHQFLLNQPSLTDVGLGIFTDIHDPVEFGATFLPNVTRVTTNFPWLAQIIPDRPVSEVNCTGYANVDPVDLIFFTCSAAPIKKISINYTYLYPKSGQLLASIFPSLTHLNIGVALLDRFLGNIVRGPDFFRI
jgi:hypothetical protein